MLMCAFNELERHGLANAMARKTAPGITIEERPGSKFARLIRSVRGWPFKMSPASEGLNPDNRHNTPIVITVGPETEGDQNVTRLMLKEIFRKWPAVRVERQPGMSL